MIAVALLAVFGSLFFFALALMDAGDEIDWTIGIFNVLHPPLSPEGQTLADETEAYLRSVE